MGQNIESKAWLVFKCILYEKETCILDVQDTILKASKWTLWELKVMGCPKSCPNQVFFELFERS